MTDEMTMEEAFEKLEEVIEALERGEGSLEEAFAGYEKGIRLLKTCSDKIDKVEKQIQVLVSGEEGGYDGI